MEWSNDFRPPSNVTLMMMLYISFGISYWILFIVSVITDNVTYRTHHVILMVQYYDIPDVYPITEFHDHPCTMLWS